MGLIKAFVGAAGGTMADQWKEFFYCDSLSESTLVTKGQKRTSKRSSNTKGEDNIISNGALISVNDGQCMIIVEQGQIVDFSAEPGQYTFDKSTEPSLFHGNLGESILGTFKEIGKRFTFGGDTGIDQRVYYFNIKEIIGNRYGSANPIPFRVIDKNIGLDIDISIRCHGEYSYKLSDPLLFYKNVCGNVESAYTRDRLDSQLKSELMTALQPAFAKISAMGIRYSELPMHTNEIASALNDVLSQKWSKARGISVASFGVSSIKASEEDENMIKQLQRNAVMRDPSMAAATLVGAQSEAMQAAAKNSNAGPVMAFAGLNMASNAGGANIGSLYSMAAEQKNTDNTRNTNNDAYWKCSCGETENKGSFCITCGKMKATTGWKCASCGTFNKGNFCAECGNKKPENAKAFRCDKCGWEPEDKSNPPKFCPECGDPFNDNDIVK